MQAQLPSSVLGLLATGCDFALTRQKEQEFIWSQKKPFRLTFVKGLFISMRYLAFVIHIVNIVLSSIWTVEFSNAQRASEEACRILLIFQIISCYTMLLLLQLILMLRVFALYNRSLRMAIFLFLLFACRTAMSIYTSFSKSAHSPRHIKFGNPTLVFIYGELLVQLVIHGLAWKRTIWDLRQYYSYPPPALLSVLNRDSLKVFMGISVAMAAVGVATLKIFFPVTFIFPLFISLVSALGCRTILNLQRLDALTEPGTSEPHKEPELTTIDNSSMTNWDAAWDSTTFHMEDSHPHRDTR
ncbi:hypothetical protein LENED_006001 [Lentinula edodes]|uniref:Uncharacterized protein n=1 Tax=Lentinula edodes TaxID=5353 RepID=A0A1Q3EAV3_LENED|nr:hypothetical protein LENED_006001 [Lentinula edodes]